MADIPLIENYDPSEHNLISTISSHLEAIYIKMNALETEIIKNRKYIKKLEKKIETLDDNIYSLADRTDRNVNASLEEIKDVYREGRIETMQAISCEMDICRNVLIDNIRKR